MADANIEVPLVGEPRESDELHRQIQEHLLKCRQCQEAIAANAPRGFGKRGKQCQEYWQIHEAFAQEGPPEGTLHNA